jgi:hypothetical protein
MASPDDFKRSEEGSVKALQTKSGKLRSVLAGKKGQEISQAPARQELKGLYD